MSRKEFAQRTGIAESSISDWKKKWTENVIRPFTVGRKLAVL